MSALTAPAIPAPYLPHYDHPAPRVMDDRAAAYAYAALEHRPGHRRVLASYEALINETVAQYVHMTSGTGLGVLFHSGRLDYGCSADMFADLERGRLHTRLSYADGLPADHPMALLTPWGTVDADGIYRQLSFNDLFRAVHDVNGHYGAADAPHYSFGPNGERSAWLRHRATYSPAALPALWCETRGQSAWVNDYADHGALPLAARPFPVQKAGIVPAALV